VFFLITSIVSFSQIPELSISKKFADTCTINFSKPDSGQFIRMYPVNFLDTTNSEKVFLDDAFYDTLTMIINSLPNCKFELASHSDSYGQDPKNINITKKRAQGLMLYLMQQCGVQKKNIIARGYGEQQLLNNCDDGIECTKEQHTVNRRIELKIIGFIE
ncbi:MAG: OmpA family protein, partial [Fimbriimonadaceae bacterium]|nr:OmpA family protein [Chitinophagales bacterium]